MKKLLLAIAFIVLGLYANAQKPNWIKIKPTPTNNTYLYVVESATGKTEMAARNSAIAEVLRSTALRLGMPFESEAISKALQNGTDYSVISRQYNIPINKVCEYSEYYDYQYRVYILCQVAKAGNKDVNFDDFSKCYEGIKNIRQNNDSFIRKGYNQYISLSLGSGITYGGKIGFAASYRFGGRLGLEPHVGLGWSGSKKFNAISGKNGRLEEYSQKKVNYSVGLNIFVFKGFYIGANYSGNELFVIDHFYDDYDNRYEDYINWDNGYYHEHGYKYEEYVYSQIYGYCNEEQDRFDVDYYKGMSFVAGYKFYFGDKNAGACGYLDFGAGVKFYSETNPDLGFDKKAFTWNVGIGFAF